MEHRNHTEEERAARTPRIVNAQFSEEELAQIIAEEDARQDALQAAYLAEVEARRAYDDAEHARRRSAFVKANGGFDRRELAVEEE